MNGTVIVWDLETVPDLRGFAAANGLVGKTDDEVREAIGDKFPKHIYHSIACIGALVARAEDDHWAVDALGAPHVGDRTEKQLISAFVGKIADLNPQLVTFNGNSFDLPVLRYRAMIHAVSAGVEDGKSAVRPLSPEGMATACRCKPGPILARRPTSGAIGPQLKIVVSPPPTVVIHFFISAGASGATRLMPRRVAISEANFRTKCPERVSDFWVKETAVCNSVRHTCL
jgi:hypothetical protein